MLKYLFSFVVVAAVVSLGVFIDGQSKLFDRSEPEFHTTAIGLSRPVFAQGRIEGITEEVELRPRLPGRLVELAAEEGDVVDSGTILLRVDEQQYLHEVSSAKAEVQLTEAQLQRVLNGAREEERREAQSLFEAKRAELERTRTRWEREKKLVASGATTPQTYDDLRTTMSALAAELDAAKARVDLLNAPARPDEVAIAEARVAAARAGLEKAQVQLDRATLRAPLSGRILQVNVETGELVGPESTEAAIVMADTSSYRVRALVEELDAPRVALGMKATVTADGLPGQAFSGHVIRLSPQMSSKKIWSDDPTERFDTKVREVWIELEPTTVGLVVGLRVDVVIDVNAKGNSEEIHVTSSSVFSGDAGL